MRLLIIWLICFCGYRPRVYFRFLVISASIGCMCTNMCMHYSYCQHASLSPVRFSVIFSLLASWNRIPRLLFIYCISVSWFILTGCYTLRRHKLCSYHYYAVRVPEGLSFKVKLIFADTVFDEHICNSLNCCIHWKYIKTVTTFFILTQFVSSDHLITGWWLMTYI